MSDKLDSDDKETAEEIEKTKLGNDNDDVEEVDNIEADDIEDDVDAELEE